MIGRFPALGHLKSRALRYTSATLFLSNGTKIKNIATRLGYTRLETINRYAHAVDQAERQARTPSNSSSVENNRLEFNLPVR